MANPLREIMVERRAALGLSQAAAAKAAGLCRNTWSRWESTIRLPRPGAWLIIAKTLKMTLAQLQRAAAKSLAAMGGGEAKQPGESVEDPGKAVEPDAYVYACVDAELIDRQLTNIDLHKLTQGGWHFHMEVWRAQQREILRGIDLLVRACQAQGALFQRLHTILLGNETGRVLPLPKYQPGGKKSSPPPPKRGPRKGGGGKNKKKR